MWQRIREIVRKELRQALREPRMRAVLIGPPLLQLIIFGYAVNLDVDRATMAWVDHDRTPESRELLAAFQGSGRFELVAAPSSEAEIQKLLDSGEAQAAVTVLPGFARALERRRSASVQVIVDGTNSNTASLISGYAAQIIGGFRMPPAAGNGVRSRVWFNPDMRSRNYFVPGVMVNIIMLVTLMLTALAIVREKEIGTMEQLMVTPVRPLELMLGKTLPFAVVGLVDAALITAAALLVFRIPFRGSPLLLLVATILFLLTTLAAGLFLSTISQTQQQAMMASTFFALPAFMLSGFAFPIHNMPEVVQWITYLNPLRYFMNIVRGVFLKGVGFQVLWPQLAALAAYGVIVVYLSAARFHKRLD